ncbi:MAG: polysaccharide deacetylase family protein [Lachnospiraceae bacterium]|nr:polysaccharide deacetylase family protein [Lachnospiraceae bacterium]
MGRKKKWLVLFLILLILAACGSAIYVWFQNETQKKTVVAETEILEVTDYSAMEEIAAAKQKLEEDPEIPMVITDINTIDKKVALCFEGAADNLVLEQIMEYLDAHDMTATFFISAVDAGEDQEIIDEIINAGHDIESYTLYGTSHMEKMSTDELITDFCRAQVVYEDKISKRPDLLKCNATEYTDDLLKTAEACGYKCIVYPTQYLNYQSFNVKEVAENYVAGLDRGTVISIKLSGYLDELEYEEEVKDEDPAKDKQPGLELHDLEEEELTETERLLRVVEWFLECLDEEEYETVRLQEFPAQDMGDLVLEYNEIEDQYREAMVEPITAVHTTDREMSFTFRGLGNEKELTNLLDVLQNIEAKVTFFVTGQEIETYPEQVQQIIDAGHEVGSGGYLGKFMGEMSFAQICEDIYKNDIMLERMGVKTDLFMPPSGAVTEEIQMAAAAMGKQIITYNSSPTRTDYVAENYTAQEAIQKYYKNGKLVFCRGDIVYFNMGLYDDDTSIADLVNTAWEMKIKPTLYGTREDNILRVATISELLDNTWNYPAVTNASYHQIEMSGKMQGSWNEMLRHGYIGNPYLAAPGFTEEEKSGFDWTGRVKTGGTNTVFLTFDDWGNEQTIGKILYVLRKHKIKATFFIRSEYVMDGTSENLLRAIAEEGHDVASHTHTHMPIDITPDQITALQQDLVNSNRTLANVVGDTRMLTDYFRPPTLAVNKTGLQTIYECGYGYIISGDVSTADYHASSVDDLYDILLNGARLDSGDRVPIQDGSVVVMHINTNAVYTAQGLDRYLNYIESLPDGDPNKFNFAKLSTYLY